MHSATVLANYELICFRWEIVRHVLRNWSWLWSSKNNEMVESLAMLMTADMLQHYIQGTFCLLEDFFGD